MEFEPHSFNKGPAQCVLLAPTIDIIIICIFLLVECSVRAGAIAWQYNGYPDAWGSSFAVGLPMDIWKAHTVSYNLCPNSPDVVFSSLLMATTTMRISWHSSNLLA
eukprot:6437907-Karenia_brevis.AAC.1